MNKFEKTWRRSPAEVGILAEGSSSVSSVILGCETCSHKLQDRSQLVTRPERWVRSSQGRAKESVSQHGRLDLAPDEPADAREPGHSSLVNSRQIGS